MSEAANKQLARRWFEEVWNQGRESTIDELFHADGKAYGFPEPDSILIGHEGFKSHPPRVPHRRRPRLSRHRKKITLPGSSF
jgi:hypothetical protein